MGYFMVIISLITTHEKEQKHMAGHIVYQKQRGIEYARFVISTRKNGQVLKDVTNLGRVLDRSAHVFRSMKRGVFTFDPETKIYGRPPSSFVDTTVRKNSREQLILDFGDAYFFECLLRKFGLMPAIEVIGYGNPDSLVCMILYYIISSMSNSHAVDWYEGSFARIMHPLANLSSQRISDLLESVGRESSMRRFFMEYLKLVAGRQDGTEILIDSTGLPNGIHFPLTAISTHGGQTSSEARLIYVVQQRTNMPLYFRYVAGSIVDVSTLIATMRELKAHGVNTRFAILDAGYMSDTNIIDLCATKVSFVSRLRHGSVILKRAMDEHLDTLVAIENAVTYNERLVFIKCLPVTLDSRGDTGYLYLCCDLTMKAICTIDLVKKEFNTKNGTDMKAIIEKLGSLGIFGLISTRKIGVNRVLPTYYMRQQIEQVFDVGKNYANLLPLSVEKEDTFRGHLLIAFIAAIVVKCLQDALKNTKLTPLDAVVCLGNQKCKVFENVVIPGEPTRKARELYRLMKIDYPAEVAR